MRHDNERFNARVLISNPRAMIALLEYRIEVNKLQLKACTLIGNDTECLRIRHRIADADIAILRLTGDLPS